MEAAVGQKIPPVLVVVVVVGVVVVCSTYESASMALVHGCVGNIYTVIHKGSNSTKAE